jgi:hypothetical protein
VSVPEAIREGCVSDIINAKALLNPTEWDQDGLVLGVPLEIQNLAALHPPFDIVCKLWDIFLERVDPLIKLLHTPTFW